MQNFKKYSYKRVILLTLSILLLFSFSSTAFAMGQSQDANIIRSYIKNNYVNEVNINNIDTSNPEDLFENLDTHSQYYSQKEFQSFIENITGEFYGIGVYIQEQDGWVVVTEPIKGSPAEAAGLIAGDKIMFVDGKYMKGKSTEEVASHIKGPLDTDVKVGVGRGEEVLYFTITRSNIIINPIEVDIIDDVGYIKINQFNQHTRTNFYNTMGKLFFKDLDKLIIDVRNNPGGSLDEVAAVSRLLIPRGPIVHIDYKSHRETYVSLLRNPMFKNLVVLVNENSASASEILAGAVQDTGVGTIIGKPTYGKGSVQRIYFLPTGAGFKLTEALYRTPSGTKIDSIGIVPDIEVDRFSVDLDIESMTTKDLLSREYDQQLNYAIKYLNKN